MADEQNSMNGSLSSFTTASNSHSLSNLQSAAGASSGIEQYKIAETIKIRERLAELNSKDLRHYFLGIRKLYNDLISKKEEHAVEVLLHQETLKKTLEDLHNLRKESSNIRQKIVEENLNYSNAYQATIGRIKKEAPELATKIEELTELRKKLDYLKFSHKFGNLRDDIRKHLRKANYAHLLENYRKLLKIPRENPEYATDSQCRREFAVKSSSLAQFLELELRSALSNVYARINFPFEEPVDLEVLKNPIVQSVQILKCLKLIDCEMLAEAGANIVTKTNSQPLDTVLEEFTKRFNYHFYGDRPTNMASKPEWFFTQLSYWAENNLEYFEQHIQPFLNEIYGSTEEAGCRGKQTAKDLFLQHLMNLALLKVHDILRQEQLVQDRRRLSHLIDECVLFEREMMENYGYPEEAPVHVVAELCQNEVLEMWIKLERDTLSAGVDAILSEAHAFEPRYQEAADVDPYLVPNFADSFVILMQSMSERYRSIPDLRVQCRFLKLQLVIVDEFRSRIVQIGQSIQHDPWTKPFPQLMNALWYLTLVLNDWSDSPEFVRLQFYLQQLQQPSSVAASSLCFTPSSAAPTDFPFSAGSQINSLARGTFDESASLYRHVWRQFVRNLCDTFSDAIRAKLAAYGDERWYAWEGPPQPGEVTPSLEPFLRKVKQLLQWIVDSVSPDSVLTLHHLTNHEVWTALDQCVISRTAFNYRGAAQILYDATNALIPLLNFCYGKVKTATEFDIFNEKCVHVLSTLRLLSLPPPAAILLKDELKYIPEQQLDEKLDQFHIVGLTKARVMEIFEQRCDLSLIPDL